MCCSICALSLFPTKSHFTLCPTFPQKALQQASESSAGHPRSNVHPRGRKCMKRNNNESKETGFSTCLSRRAQKIKNKKVGFFTQMPDILHCGLWGWAMGGESVRWSTSCTTDYSLVCLVNKGAKKMTPERSLAGGLKPDCGCCVEQCHCNKKLRNFFPQHSWRICFSHFLFSVGWENGHHSHVCALSITLWPAFLNFRWLSTNKNIFYCYLPFLPIDLHESDTLALQRYQTLYVLWGLLGYLDIWASVCHVTEE